MSAEAYISAFKAVLPDWNVMIDEPYGILRGVGIERNVGGKWQRGGWNVKNQSPRQLANIARRWADSLEPPK